jgi:hypothetical protein
LVRGKEMAGRETDFVFSQPIACSKEKKDFLFFIFLQIIADISSVRIFSNAHWVNTLLNYASDFPNLKRLTT